MPGSARPPTASIRREFLSRSLSSGAGCQPPWTTKAPPERGFLEAGDGIRTRDPQLGKLMLYQLSYTRVMAQPYRTPRVFVLARQASTRLYSAIPQRCVKPSGWAARAPAPVLQGQRRQGSAPGARFQSGGEGGGSPRPSPPKEAAGRPPPPISLREKPSVRFRHPCRPSERSPSDRRRRCLPRRRDRGLPPPRTRLPREAPRPSGCSLSGRPRGRRHASRRSASRRRRARLPSAARSTACRALGTVGAL